MVSSETILPLLFRWIHFVAGITWIGLLYYFNLVQVPFMKETDATTKGGVVLKLVPRALWWFRWSALVTVLAGVFLLMTGRIFNTAIMIGGTLGVIMFLNVWLVIWPNQKVVIRMTGDAVATKTAPAPEMAKHARIAYLASRTNFYLSFPMLLFMGMSAHFPQF
ncbi:MAG: urate hydroxylase PuuD [Nitrospirae bacterium]|nr:urate hydroxylase PuuD [Candidatus Manganitrophaceae bacterium]